MTNTFRAMVLAAQSDDTDSWMHVIFVVGMLIFWAIGGILKALKRERGAEPEDQRQPAGPAQGAKKEPPWSRPRRLERPVSQPGGQSGPSAATTSRVKPESARLDQTKAQSAWQSHTHIETGQLVATAHDAAREISQDMRLDQRTALTATATPLFVAGDIEQLRRAILYREVLGKPVALKNPLEGIGEP